MMRADLSVLRTIWTPSGRAQRRILIVNGHPDPRPERFCAALCEAFAKGAHAAGHDVRHVRLGDKSRRFGADLEQLWRSERLFVVYPMWMDGPPRALRQLFDAFESDLNSDAAGGHHKNVRIVVTASLPSLLYGAGKWPGKLPHALRLPGIRDASATIIGSVDTISNHDRERWLLEMRRLGSERN
jgi:putative NADPH-quinone reductase